MTQTYKLTKEADADLEDITRYTIKKWGKRKAVEYLGLIEKGLCSTATSKIWKQPFPEKHPKLRVMRCEHHYIFYLHNEGKYPDIIAVLHERMEMFTHIKNRLG